MKNILLCLILLFGVATFSGCACNYNVWDFNYQFDCALVYENGEWVEYQVEKWADYENDAVCIWTKDGKMIMGSLNNIILINRG